MKAELIAGVDEAGRGPLAGPVMVAAVILDPARPVEGLADSKKLSAPRRSELAACIRERALAHVVVPVPVPEIDRLNILQACLHGMQQAVAGLGTPPVRVLVDGNRTPEFHCEARAVVGGDATVPAISAASILAKVVRDEYMCELDGRFPGYEFARHKGYGTRAHLEALFRLGPCPEHRRSFAPVRAAMADLFAPRENGIEER